MLLDRLADTRPLRDAALAVRLEGLARRLDVHLDGGILEWRVGSGTGHSALVAGAGRGRRVLIASTLVRDWSAEEIAVVVAHELAHHRHRDLWRAWALDTAVLAGAALAAHLAVTRLGPALGVAGVGDLASLPLAALAGGAAWIAATPLRHAQSRRHERRADATALALTGGADAFRAAVRRLGESHLAEERPSRLTRWLFHRHPPMAERLAAADAFQHAARRAS
jgi:STE24 endopeptidase